MIEKIKEIGTFLYETPLQIPLSLISATALVIIFPPIAPPFFAYGITAMISRLIGKVIPISKDNLLEFHAKFGLLRYVILALSIFLCYILPIAGIALAIAIGFYEGIVSEFESIKLKQAQSGNQNLPPQQWMTMV